MIFELRKIIDVQEESIKDNDKIIEFQLESLTKGLGRMNDMRDEIEYLSNQLTKQKELTKDSDAKAKFLEKEINTLHSDTPSQENCEETLRKSLEELHVGNVILKEKIDALSTHESKLKVTWEKEKIPK